ncbi:MAG: hypothetical protein RR810_06145 [Clostridia bacterium]
MKKTNKILLSIVIAIILAVVLFFVFKHDYALLQKNKEKPATGANVNTVEDTSEDTLSYIERSGETINLTNEEKSKVNLLLNKFISPLVDIKEKTMDKKITTMELAAFADKAGGQYITEHFIESEKDKASVEKICNSRGGYLNSGYTEPSKNLRVVEAYSVQSADNDERKQKLYHVYKFVKLNKDIENADTLTYDEKDVIGTYLLKIWIYNLDGKINAINKI